MRKTQNLYRSNDGIFLGVCQGIADYFDFSAWGLRLFVIAMAIVTQVVPMILLYVGLAIILKKSPYRRFYRYDVDL